MEKTFALGRDHTILRSDGFNIKALPRYSTGASVGSTFCLQSICINRENAGHQPDFNQTTNWKLYYYLVAYI